MQDVSKSGIDPHRLTASSVTGTEIEQVTDSQRQAAKIMNFLLIYGGSAKTLQWRVLSDYGIFIPLKEAEEAREVLSGLRWRKRMAGAAALRDEQYHSAPLPQLLAGILFPASHLHKDGPGQEADLASLWNRNQSQQVPDVQYTLSGYRRRSDQAGDG